MIIDTNIEDIDKLKAYSYLIIEDLLPNKDEKWEHTKYNSLEININNIFKDGLCLIEFGNLDKKIEITDNYDYIIHSLKGMPINVDEFILENSLIDIIDYLPLSKDYFLDDNKTSKITYPFPKEIGTLSISENYLENFKNFPKKVDQLYISNNKFKSLKGSPYITNYVYLGNIELKDISDLKGSFNQLVINCCSIKELPILPKELKTIDIQSCDLLENVDSLLLNEYTKICIQQCPNIDLYTLHMSKVELQHIYHDFNFMYKDIIEENDIEKLRSEGRYKFEEKLFNKYLDDNDLFKHVPFKEEYFINKRNNLLKSKDVEKKYNL